MRKLSWSLALATFAVACAAATASAQDPKALYEKNCKVCHGPVGGGPTAIMKSSLNPPKLFDAAFLAKTDHAAFMTAMEKGGAKMTPLAGKMTKQQMEAVEKYIRDYVKSGGK